MNMTHLTRLAVAGCLVGLLAGLSGWLSATDARAAAFDAFADFVPHSGVYDLSLDHSRESGDVRSARGRLDFEWGDVCDGWTVMQRTRVMISPDQGPEIDFGWTLDAWESKDGLRYRFFIKYFSDGRQTESFEGEAELEAIGGPGLVRMNKPEEQEFPLPAGTVFPSWHSFELMDAAAKDRLPMWRIVFDGAGEDGLSGVSAVLGKRYPPEDEGLLDSPLMQTLPSYRILLAYFALDEADALPLNEHDFRLFPNGVTEDFVFGYEDFAVRARLLQLEELPPSGC
jgi:hypothetical protein